MRAIFNKQNKHNSKKGFSLAEVLIAVCLMAFVAVAAIGGIVVLTRVRDDIDRQTKANMIMIATVSYLTADLNDCQNPATMDCSVDYSSKNGPLFFVCSERYIDVVVRDKNGTATAWITRNASPKVQYWNTSSGIYVRLTCTGYSNPPSGFSKPQNNRTYIIAQNIMEGTGMYSRIGGNGKINYDDTKKLFEFTVEVVDSNTGEVVLSQDVSVCPDVLIPSFTITP